MAAGRTVGQQVWDHFASAYPGIKTDLATSTVIGTTTFFGIKTADYKVKMAQDLFENLNALPERASIKQVMGVLEETCIALKTHGSEMKVNDRFEKALDAVATGLAMANGVTLEGALGTLHAKILEEHDRKYTGTLG